MSIFLKINEVLMYLNPLNVDGEALNTEYLSYVSSILKAKKEGYFSLEKQLTVFLSQLDPGFSEKDEVHMNLVKEAANRIMNVNES